MCHNITGLCTFIIHARIQYIRVMYTAILANYKYIHKIFLIYMENAICPPKFFLGFGTGTFIKGKVLENTLE